MRLVLEIEGEGRQDALPGEGADLVALMSFAVVRGFGAQHPLIALAERLQALGVRLGPLTTFYEIETEDAEDVEKLEMAWQDPSGLRESLEGLHAALASDPQAQALAQRAGATGLAAQAGSIIPALRRAEAAGRRARLAYAL